MSTLWLMSILVAGELNTSGLIHFALTEHPIFLVTAIEVKTMEILVLTALVLLIIYAVKKRQYEKTEYYQQTQNSYLKVLFDKGLLGEFYTYECLKPLDGYKRYLFNLYVPKDDGETTELDVVLLHESGVYVLESKNYSGWIFGTESQKYWTQTLPAGRGRSQKERFFNPIMQNKGHIKWLQAFLADQTLPIYSYIVFSDRCILKKITLTSGKHHVLNRRNLLLAIRKNISKAGVRLSQYDIDALFQMLFPLTQMDAVGKKKHIENVERKKMEARKWS